MQYLSYKYRESSKNELRMSIGSKIDDENDDDDGMVAFGFFFCSFNGLAREK